MTLKYEQVYSSFLSLTHQEQLNLVESIISKRNTYIAQPAKENKAKSKPKSVGMKALDQLTTSEKAELLAKIERGEI